MARKGLSVVAGLVLTPAGTCRAITARIVTNAALSAHAGQLPRNADQQTQKSPA